MHTAAIVCHTPAALRVDGFWAKWRPHENTAHTRPHIGRVNAQSVCVCARGHCMYVYVVHCCVGGNCASENAENARFAYNV